MLKKEFAVLLTAVVVAASGCSTTGKEGVREATAENAAAPAENQKVNRVISEARGPSGRWSRDLPRNGRVEFLGEVEIGGRRRGVESIDIPSRLECSVTHVKFTAGNDDVALLNVIVNYRNGLRDQIDLNDRDDRGRDWDRNSPRRPPSRGLYLAKFQSSGWLDIDDVLDGRTDGRCVTSIMVVGEDGRDNPRNRRDRPARVTVDGLVRDRRHGSGPGPDHGRDRDHGPNPPPTRADADCYLDQYPDICRASANYCRNPQQHFEDIGRREGRYWGCFPTQEHMDGQCYLKRYQDICANSRELCRDPRSHYERFGRNEGRIWGEGRLSGCGGRR